MKIVLGSSSKYRGQILREMGYAFEVVSPEVDEKAIRSEDPAGLVLALAEAKGDAVAGRVSEEALVITADQVVAQRGAIREKPCSEEEARFFLRTAGEAPVETISAVTVTHVPGGTRASGIDTVRIYLDPLPETLLERLIRDGEVLHCAGALRIEDPLLAPSVRRMEGTIDSVMGLPKALAQRLLDEVRAQVGHPK